MWYIFKDNNCIASCDFEPNLDDLASRDEIAVESTEVYDIGAIILVDEGIQKKPTYVPALNESKQAKLTELYLYFCAVRDALTWVQTDTYRYGYDRKTDDIANFLATWKRIETKIKNNEADQTVPYKVWTSATTKELIPHTLEMMEVCLAQSEQEQKAAYITLKEKQIEVEAATTKEQLDLIVWPE